MTTQEVATRPEIRPTLPSHYYYDLGIHEREKEKIFYGSWMCVGRANEIEKPGEFFIRSVADESIIVLRDKAGNVNAFYNVCRHRGSRLCGKESGRFKGGALSCPYHSWTYALDGRLISTPNMLEADNFRREELSLYSVAVNLWEGFIFVNLSQVPGPFVPNLGHIAHAVSSYNLPNLRVGHQKVYEVQANWKLVVENFTECFHCPPVHPELCEIVPGFKRGIIRQEEAEGALFIEGGNSLTRGAETSRPLISTLKDGDLNRFRSTTVYPNLLLVLVPDHVEAFVLWPTGPKSTRVVFEWLFEPSTIEAPGFDPTDTVSFTDLVNRQDWGICEEVQRGIQSRAHRVGVYSPQEHLPYKFNQWVLERLNRKGDEP